MRKVLHVGPCNAPGGMATVMHTLADHPPEGWKADVLPTYSSGSLWSKWMAYRTARRTLKERLSGPSPVKVVHVHVASDWSWVRKARLIRLAQGFDAGVVVHLHSGAFEHWIGSKPRVQRQFRQLTAHPRTTLVVLNEHWKARMSPYTGDVVAVNNPIPSDVRLSTIQRDEHHLLLLGRRDAVKGHAFAESLMPVLRKKQPNARLTMTGLTHSDVEGVTGLGWVEAEKKQALLETATLLLVPSSFEGQPMVVLEAMASGCQVVLSSRIHMPPGAAHVANHGDVEDWVNRIAFALEHPIEGHLLRMSVKEHELQAVQPIWKEIYQELEATSSSAE